MRSLTTKIAVNFPDDYKPGRYFSFNLKNDIVMERSEYRQPRQMVVVSDVEDAFTAFCKILIRKKVISRHFRWVYNDGHLVILGNKLREGKPKAEFLWFIYSLEEQARQNGGHVHLILGERELYSMGQSWNDHPQYAIKPDRSRSPSTAIFNGNLELLNWLRSKNIAEKIGEFLFIHESVLSLAQFSSHSLVEINQRARITLKNNTSLPMPIMSSDFNNNATAGSGITSIFKYLKVTHIITGNQLACASGLLIPSPQHSSNEQLGFLISKKGIFRITSEGKKERLTSYMSMMSSPAAVSSCTQ